MADDEFDIDIYGDANDAIPNIESATVVDSKKEEESDMKIDSLEPPNDHSAGTNDAKKIEDHDDYDVDIKLTNGDKDHTMTDQQKIKSTDESSNDLFNIPRQAPQQQGVKRKGSSDDRLVDPGATTAILISDLHWWNTDDDVRGWVNQAQVEDELKDITFSEHKVNGKSKGQAYVEFGSQQAATAAKHKIDAFGEGQQYVKKHVVTYSNPNINPFRTLPKDTPARAGKEQSNRGESRGYSNDRGSHNGGNFGGNFRGRGNYTPRGAGAGMNNNMNHFNRNFAAPAMNNMGGGGGFNPAMGGFAGNGMGGQFGGGFNNRGGMMGNMRASPGMRGRGGMGNNMMGGMNMAGMPMGGMPGGMGIPMNMQMGGGMPAGGFQGMQPGHFNPAFFQQNQAAGSDWQNPHGAKRPRPE